MLVGGFLSLLILAGAGCGSQEPAQTKPAETGTQTENESPTEKPEETKSGDFTLEATPAGKGRVQFTWSAPENARAKDGFRIVRGPQADPRYPGNFWYHPKDATTEAFWINLPKGTQHFRVCAFEQNACTSYSNDVTVTIE